MVEPDGERYLVVWPLDGGALTRLAPAQVDRGLIAGAAWLHTTGMCLRAAPVAESVLAAMRIARDAGVPVSIDLNLRLELWGLPDTCGLAVDRGHRAGRRRAGQWCRGAGAAGTGVRVRGRAEPRGRLGRWRAARGPSSRGWVPEGALALWPDGRGRRGPGIRTDMRNPVGAGDAFNGGFIAARVAGLPLPDALRWGNAVGALKVARDGGARDQPSRAEVEALLAR